MSLADQIRQQWGQYGEWSAGGVDRIQELADLLARAGVTDISELAFKDTPDAVTVQGGIDSSGNPLNQSTIAGRQLMAGDKALGYLGNVNLDNTIGGNESQYLQDNERLGWSARGEGNVSYNVVQGPNGPMVVPAWGSSSDMDTVRDLVKGAALVGGIAYGANALAGAGSGGAAAGGASGGANMGQMIAGSVAGPGTTGYGTGAGLFSSAAGGLSEGVGTMSSMGTNTTPLLETGTLSQMSPVTMAEMGAGGSLASPAINSMGGAMNWGQMLKDYGPIVTGLLGAASGARDQTQTASKEPWAPAQPFLKDVLSHAGGMLPQYLSNPLSPQQQAALSNSMGIVNGANAAMPGLLANLNAVGGGYNRAGGANRSRVNFTPLQFSGLLGNIPGGR